MVHRSPTTRSGSGVQVLVVEDDEDLREASAGVLESDGYEVQRAASAAEAIELAAAWRPRVVVTDLEMPGMSGIELCEYFLHEYAPPAPGVVVVSGIVAAEPEALRKGARAFLSKPYGPDELLVVVRAALEGPPGKAPTEQFTNERERERAAARAMAEAAFGSAIATYPELQAEGNHVARWLGGFYRPATAALLFPLNGRLDIYASSDPERVAGGSPPVALKSIAETVLETGSTIIVPDIAVQPWLGPSSGEFRSIVSVPFRYRQVPVGALCLVAPVPRAFGATDAAILEHLAAQATTRLTGTRAPVLSPSWLISHNSFQRILGLEARAAADDGDGIAIVLFRMRVDRSLAALLGQLPARRMQLGELRADVVGLSVRAPGNGARDAAKACAALVYAHGGVATSAELLLGPPVPSSSHHELLAWAQQLLDKTEDAPGHSCVVVDTRAVWSAASG
jgi:CheY-like chemotaxis protein/putative methionine-R-sulfoxide reductase with GAF domain